MNTLKDRLIEFVNHIGLGQTAFEEKVGISRGYISNMKANGNMTGRLIERITKQYPELNTDWLQWNKGQMLKETPPPAGESASQEQGTPVRSISSDMKKNESSDTTIASLAESNRVLAEASKVEAEAIRKIAEANYDLVQMLKHKEAIASAHLVDQLSDEEKLRFARAIKEELEAKRYPNAEAVYTDWIQHDAPGH